METANRSWLRIPGTGFMIQPSEFVKFTFICTFSKHLFSVRDRINHPLTVLQIGLHAGLIVGLILLSGDLGVALVYTRSSPNSWKRRQVIPAWTSPS